MHPLIAFLTFVFSPTDDWLLKKSFELVIDPSDVKTTASSYDRVSKAYPSRFQTADGAEINPDLSADAVWAEALHAQGRHESAVALWRRLETDKSLPTELKDDISLRIGESLLVLGQPQEAEQRFTALASQPLNPRRIDADVNLLICELARGDGQAALARADSIRAYAEREPLSFRANLPLGLADYAAGQYEQARARLAPIEDDRARYFEGLSLRRLGRAKDEIACWQRLRTSRDTAWAQLGDLQLAETYFALGDDGLSRGVAEQSLARAPHTAVAPDLQFRLAAIDFRAKNFDGALARLDALTATGALQKRATILMAESLAKTGRSKELFGVLAKMPEMKKSAEGVYQTAWAAMIEKRFEEAIATGDRGLAAFHDPEFTPRLLLLEGLAFEYLGRPAEALAAYQTVADRFPTSVAAGHGAHWTTLAYLRLNRPLDAASHGGYLWNHLSDSARRQTPDTAFWLGEAHLRLKRWDDADKNYADFIALAPATHDKAGTALFQRSITLAQLKKPNDAIALLDAFRENARNAQKPELVALAHLQQGNILFNERQFEPAVASYRAAGDNEKAKFHEALALYRMDYVTDAIETWTKLVAATPNGVYAPKAAFRAARATFELGHAKEAVAAYATFIAQFPSSPDVKAARLQSAHALYNAGDAAGALPLYADYLARYHDTDDLASVSPYLASCLLKTGKTAAEAELAMAGLPPTDAMAEIQWTEGAKNYNDKAYENASDRFTTLAYAMPTYENAGPALFYRAESLYQAQNWFSAEGAYNSFLTVQTDADRDADQAATAYFHRGVSEFNQDRLLDAAASFAAVSSHYPQSPMAADAAKNLVLCYRGLGDFSTATQMGASDAVPPEFETVVDNQPVGPRRGVTEIPQDLSLHRPSPAPDSTLAGNLASDPAAAQ